MAKKKNSAPPPSFSFLLDLDLNWLWSNHWRERKGPNLQVGLSLLASRFPAAARPSPGASSVTPETQTRSSKSPSLRPLQSSEGTPQDQRRGARNRNPASRRWNWIGKNVKKAKHPVFYLLALIFLILILNFSWQHFKCFSVTIFVSEIEVAAIVRFKKYVGDSDEPFSIKGVSGKFTS